MSSNYPLLGFVIAWLVMVTIAWKHAPKLPVPKTLLIDDLRDIKADVVARTYDDGIKALKSQGPFTVLYLDHDLGDQQVPERTGYSVICFLEANPQYLPGRIELVTSNPVGRRKMQTVINRLYPVSRTRF